MSLWQSTPHHVFLFHFGGPEKETDVFPFLRRLFSDPFIIRFPLGSWLRHYLARKIAKSRAPKALEEYKSIGYSPINRYTNAQAEHLQALLNEIRPGTKVHVINRYTEPFAQTVIRSVDMKAGRNFFLTLYPHLSHSTVVSSFRDFDVSYRELYGEKDFTAVRIYSWWNVPRYLDYVADALSQSVQNVLDQAGTQKQSIQILFSAHGLPKKYYDRGDPYVDEIKSHVAELKERVLQKLTFQADWHLSFQSRVGPVDWVRPYTDEMIQELGNKGGTALVLVPISFVSDHIETLFEMDQTYRQLALNSGFRVYERMALPNTDARLAQCLTDALVSSGF